MKKETIEKIKEAFEYHKDEKVLLVTSDGSIFLESAKNFAVDHANKTGGKVETVNRNEIKAINKDIKEIKSPLENMTVKEIKAYASENRIELTSTKKADLIEELKLALKSNSKLEEE